MMMIYKIPPTWTACCGTILLWQTSVIWVLQISAQLHRAFHTGRVHTQNTSSSNHLTDSFHIGLVLYENLHSTLDTMICRYVKRCTFVLLNAKRQSQKLYIPQIKFISWGHKSSYVTSKGTSVSPLVPTCCKHPQLQAHEGREQCTKQTNTLTNMGLSLRTATPHWT